MATGMFALCVLCNAIICVIVLCDRVWVQSSCKKVQPQLGLTLWNASKGLFVCFILQCQFGSQKLKNKNE